MPSYPSPRRTTPPFNAEIDLVKHNRNSTTNPLITDDRDSGYAIGSNWGNSAANRAFVCTNNVSGGAVWLETLAVGTATYRVVDLSAQANGVLTIFVLPTAAITSSIIIVRNGLTLSEGTALAGKDYQVLSATQVQFHVAPTAGWNVQAIYIEA